MLDKTALETLDARLLVQPIGSRLTIWHARSAFLAVVAKRPRRPSPVGEALASQCEKLIEELTTKYEELRVQAEASGLANHRLVVSSLADVGGLITRLNESLDELKTEDRSQG